jgi:hypothetical protein
VTSSVAAWLAGSRENNGWIMLPTGGTNNVGVQMSNTANPSQTPFLDFEPWTPPSAPPPPRMPPPPPSFSYAFNGVNSSYTGGCQSTWLRSDTPDWAGALETGIWWDGTSTVGNYDSALVQFTDIIGFGPNQLRPHEQIQRATLRYYVDTTFSSSATGATAQLNEISIPWKANTTTYRNFAGVLGIGEDKLRTPAVATAYANVANAWYEIDVTASVQSWASRVKTNNGWIWTPSYQFLGGSGDGSMFRACGAPPDRRVNLVVLAALQPPRPPSPPMQPPPPPARPPPPPASPAPYTLLTIRNAQFARLRSAAPDANYGTDTSVTWDGNYPCADSGAQTPLSAHVVGSAASAAAPNGPHADPLLWLTHVCVCVPRLP